MEEITQKLADYITKNILRQPNRKLTVDEKLISSGIVDSFSLVDLSLYIEETFGVRIEDTELNADTFDSLEQLAGLIQARNA
jgi:acyl carrier protein